MIPSFYATEEELELAAQILVSRSGDGVLQGNQAKEVFNRSGLPFQTLSDIWYMACSKENNNGLSKIDIAKAMRLIGWVQSGEMLNENLLSMAGPLPTLDGITNKEEDMPPNSVLPQIAVSPTIAESQLREFKTTFWHAGPVNGFLSEDKVMNVYMAADLSYEEIRNIINLIDRSSRRSVDFTEFACGLYLVKALQSSQLHSLPRSIPPDLFEQFKDPSSSPPSQSPTRTTYRPSATNRQSYLAPSPQLTGLSKLRRSNSPSPSPPNPNRHEPSSSSSHQVNSSEISQHDKNIFELHFRKLDHDGKGYLHRGTLDELVSVYRVTPADLDRIWGLTSSERDIIKQEEFIVAMYLVKQKSAGEEIPTSLPLSLLPSSLRSNRRYTTGAPSTPRKQSVRGAPPPIPPKKIDFVTKAASFTGNNISSTSTPPRPPQRNSLSVTPLISPQTSSNPFRHSMSPSSFPRPPVLPEEKSPFEDPPSHPQLLSTNNISRPPPPPQKSPPPPSPPITNQNIPEEPASSKSKDEISRQIEVLLGQLEAQNELRTINDGLRSENDDLKTQVNEMERMMAEILAANENEAARYRDKYSQETTRLLGQLAEKEAQCDDQERKLRLLGEEEKALRDKLREMDATILKHVAEAVDYRQTIDSQKEQIGELNNRVSVLFSDTPETGRNGTTSNRELRVVIRDVTKENEELKVEVRNMNRSMEQLLLSTKHGKYDEISLENRKLNIAVRELEGMVSQMQTSVGHSQSSSSSSPSQVLSAEATAAVSRENEQLKAHLRDGSRTFADFKSACEARDLEMQRKIAELMEQNDRLKVEIQDHPSQGRSMRGDEDGDVGGDGEGDGSAPPPAYDETYVPSE